MGTLAFSFYKYCDSRFPYNTISCFNFCIMFLSFDIGTHNFFLII